MQTITRRGFLSAAAAALPLAAEPNKMPAGFQIYPVREALVKDFAGTLKEYAGFGYRTVEMCSPPGYGAGFAPLAKYTAKEMRDVITGAGLRCDSCHYTSREFRDSLEERIAFAKELGLKQMVLSSFGVPKDGKLDAWRKAADDLNKAGETITKAGLVCGFHNHHGEFAELEGVLIYDELMKRLDPKLVKMQFQVAVVNIGFQAADYMLKYPGRFCSLHLADWSASEKKTVAVGKGVVDWKKLFAAAKKGGVKNYYVEMSHELMRESYPYLRSLK